MRGPTKRRYNSEPRYEVMLLSDLLHQDRLNFRTHTEHGIFYLSLDDERIPVNYATLEEAAEMWMRLEYKRQKWGLPLTNGIYSYSYSAVYNHYQVLAKEVLLELAE